MRAADFVETCLERCAQLEPVVKAWAFLDPAQARAQAQRADAVPTDRRGPLHGVPVGVKDIFDTADMPTENGTLLHAGRRPGADAAVVERLRAAGAIILGKTVTTELATYAPAATRNPHRLTHTPGGSSSGSAAAVAAGMVPLALGSQTNGSVIRPAAFCGVVGFKPSFGRISRRGMLGLSGSLDQVGVFALTVRDAGLLAGVLAGPDAGDPASLGVPARAIVRSRCVPAVTAPRLAVVRTPMWPRAGAVTRALFRGVVETLGTAVEEIELPEVDRKAYDAHRRIMEAEMAFNLEREWRHRTRLSVSLRGQLRRGRRCTARAYQEALGHVQYLSQAVTPALSSYDAVLTPAVPGPAPRGLASTGDPAFCTLWTLLGLPAVSIPLGRSALGLPLAVQLVGQKYADERLLQVAEWFERRFRSAPLRPRR